MQAHSQTQNFDPSNAREGETVEYCHQHVLHNKLLSNPAYVQALQEDAVTHEQEKHSSSVQKGTVYKIPVVFHVLHANGVENISEAQILDALNILNRDYRKLNADANSLYVDFAGKATDIEVEFVLATKAPNGTCFKGITRTYSSTLSYDGADGSVQVNAIASGNDVYQGNWPSNRYLNIFVCGDIGGAAGYTLKPTNFGGTTIQRGIWVLHNYVGSIGTSSVGTSRTLTHEIGHWLNLDHTWGGSNNPGIATNCTSDDGVQDTPNCIGVSSCNLTSNTCNSDDAYFGFAIHDNVENYMDYSYCSKMFTAGQATRMRAALNSSVGGRNNLWTTANLTAVGATGVTYLCKADFSTSKTSICPGAQVQFFDESYNKATGWSWSFQGGTPATSTSQNPLITYSTPGTYSVTLTATDGTSSDGETKTGYIQVLSGGAAIPFFEGFENYSTLANATNWSTYNSNPSSPAFVLETSTGHTGTKCVNLNNIIQTGSNIDELVGAPVDLSSVTSIVTLSFRFSYRKTTTSTYEYLRVFASKDCGATWVQRKSLGGISLSSLAQTTPWKPSTGADWTTAHVVNITSDYWINNFLYKFRFEGNGGNNIYLDDINIYAAAPSDNIVLGVEEQTNAFHDLSLYPNPAENELNLHFSMNNAQKVGVEIVDVFGKIIQAATINAAVGSNLVVLSSEALAPGTYFISVRHNGLNSVMKFVKK